MCPFRIFFSIRDFVQFGIFSNSFVLSNLGFCAMGILFVRNFVQFRILFIWDFIQFGIFSIQGFIQFGILSNSGFCPTGILSNLEFCPFGISPKSGFILFWISSVARGLGGYSFPHRHAEYKKYHVFSTFELDFCTAMENSPPPLTFPSLVYEHFFLCIWSRSVLGHRNRDDFR